MGHVIVYPTSCILGRASRTKEPMSDFCYPIKGTQQCGIGLPDIYQFFCGLTVGQQTPGFRASQFGIRA